MDEVILSENSHLNLKELVLSLDPAKCRAFVISSLSITVSLCHKETSREFVEEKSFRFLRVFRLFENSCILGTSENTPPSLAT